MEKIRDAIKWGIRDAAYDLNKIVTRVENNRSVLDGNLPSKEKLKGVKSDIAILMHDLSKVYADILGLDKKKVPSSVRYRSEGNR